MTHSPMTHDTPRSIKSAIRQHGHTKSAGDWLRTTMSDASLFIVMAFCAIGLLMALYLIFRFPDPGMSVEQLSQFLG